MPLFKFLPARAMVRAAGRRLFMKIVKSVFLCYYYKVCREKDSAFHGMGVCSSDG